MIEVWIKFIDTVRVTFDRSVSAIGGTDVYFTAGLTTDGLVWVGGAGTVQLAVTTGVLVAGQPWAWDPGGGHVSPDTLVRQTGVLV